MAETVKTLCRCRPTERRTWVIRWVGVRVPSKEARMDRLDAIALRPLVHPVCSACGARMWFKRSEPEYLGRVSFFNVCGANTR
jgi:hypothetical protein